MNTTGYTNWIDNNDEWIDNNDNGQIDVQIMDY